MTGHNCAKDTMRAVRFHQYGEPSDVLRLEKTEIPDPGARRIRVRMHACGRNPAQIGLSGLFGGNLPRGIGLDVSGTVDAVGEVSTISGWAMRLWCQLRDIRGGRIDE